MRGGTRPSRQRKRDFERRSHWGGKLDGNSSRFSGMEVRGVRSIGGASHM